MRKLNRAIIFALANALAVLPALAAFSEAPLLHDRVAAGTLPPLAERLPVAPLVITPVEKHGVYGGTWRMVLVGYDHQGILQRSLAYEQLVRWDPNWARVVPNVATSWTVNKTSTVFRFNLRKGLRWSDGAPFTARDIVGWMDDVVRDQELTPIPPPWLVAGGRLPECVALDDFTVEFRFAEPKVLFLEFLASIRGNLVTRYPAHHFRPIHRRHNPAGAAELVKRLGQPDWPRAFHVAYAPMFWHNSGVPTLNAWCLTNGYVFGAKTVVAERNPYYWKVDTLGRQLPYLDRVQFDVVVDDQEALPRALAGQIDYERLDFASVHPGAPAAIREAVQAGRISTVRVIPTQANPIAISLNLAHPDPQMRAALGDKRVRIALSEAINRSRLIKELYPEGGRAWQLGPQPLSPYYNRRLGEQYTEYAPERSTRLLDEAGLRINPLDGMRQLSDGRPFTINLLLRKQEGSPNWPQILDQISRDWRAAGVAMKWTALPAIDYYLKIQANLHDGAISGGTGGYAPILEPEFTVPVSFGSGANVYYAVPWARWFIDPSTVGAERPPDSVVRQMEVYRRILIEPDPAARATLMRQVLEMAADEFYVMGLCLEPGRVAIRTPGFRNVPSSHFESWTYPDPGPFHPCQFF